VTSFLSCSATGALLCALGLVSGCTSPSYGSPEGDDAGARGNDARVPPDSATDPEVGCVGAACKPDAGQDASAPELGPVTDASVTFAPDAQADGKPAWVAALVGTYAVRTRFYGREQPTKLTPFTHELVHLIEATYDAASGRVTMDAALCEDHGDIMTTPIASVRALYPDKVAHRQFNVVYQDGFFSTVAPPLLTGWHADVPDACKTGATAPRQPDQTYLTASTCACPKSDVPPTAENDCRITDSDGDGAPGQTIQVSGAFDDKNYVRVKDFSQFTRGVIASNGRHVAQFLRNEDFYVLECAGGGPCPRNSLDFCPVTEVLFEPLTTSPASGGPFTCDDVRTQKDACTLFGGCTPLTLPNGC
jgi:hypothetical protein